MNQEKIGIRSLKNTEKLEQSNESDHIEQPEQPSENNKEDVSEDSSSGVEIEDTKKLRYDERAP